MKYYRVKPEYDNKRLLKFHRGGGLEFDGILVGKELYTVKEWVKLCNTHLMGDLLNAVEEVEIKKSRVYWFFGARFEMEG